MTKLAPHQKAGGQQLLPQSRYDAACHFIKMTSITSALVTANKVTANDWYQLNASMYVYDAMTRSER